MTGWKDLYAPVLHIRHISDRKGDQKRERSSQVVPDQVLRTGQRTHVRLAKTCYLRSSSASAAASLLGIVIERRLLTTVSKVVPS